MKFTHRKRQMFQVALESEPEDALRLLDFMRFVIAGGLADTIGSHPLYAPSDMWTELCAETFVGFSASKLIIQSGHRFPEATNAVPIDRKPGLRDVLAKPRDDHSFGILWQKFGGGDLPPVETAIAQHKSLQYFLAAELDRLATPLPSFRRMLEVGAGTGVNVALLLLRYGLERVAIVDLPETIPVAFAFLRAHLPEKRILLPHEISCPADEADADIMMLLPTQADLLPAGWFDAGYNMGSFQEMPIETVNHYLALFARCLQPGGRFLSENQATARHIPGNDICRYDLAGMTETQRRTPPLRPVSGATGARSGDAGVPCVVAC